MISRSITGLALAALLAAPAAAHAQTRSTGSGIWLGGAFGLETGNDFSGYQLRGDAEVPVLRLAPNLQVSGVGSFAYSGLSHDTSLISVVPAVRLNFAASPMFGGYGDIGLGYFHVWTSHTGNSGAMMRFLAGGYYEMNTTTRFFVEAGLQPHFGDFASRSGGVTTFTLMIGAKFRI